MLHAAFERIFRGNRRIFENVTVSLHPSELLWIQGENGAGKTTLLRALAGLLSFDGKITFNTPSNATHFSSQKAFLGHEDALPEGITVAEELQFWASFFKVPQVLQQHYHTRYGLSSFLNKQTQTLSAGQKRRTALVRLFYAKAVLWLLDEPFTHLDMQTQEALKEDIQQHLHMGGSVILTSHQPLEMPYQRCFHV